MPNTSNNQKIAARTRRVHEDKSRVALQKCGGTLYRPEVLRPQSQVSHRRRLGTVQDKKMVLLTTSDNKEQRYLEYARAKFTLDGVPCSLMILEVADSGPFRGTLFLAFADQSSAIETYGAGRYLDVKKIPGASSITLDFNTAYNPYCAYSETFSCPLPPRENVLNVLIAAGEKLYH